jgi:hypothetical protein
MGRNITVCTKWVRNQLMRIVSEKQMNYSRTPKMLNEGPDGPNEGPDGPNEGPDGPK